MGSPHGDDGGCVTAPSETDSLAVARSSVLLGVTHRAALSGVLPCINPATARRAALSGGNYAGAAHPEGDRWVTPSAIGDPSAARKPMALGEQRLSPVSPAATPFAARYSPIFHQFWAVKPRNWGVGAVVSGFFCTFAG